MPKVKVTHALFTYRNAETGKRVNARRGDVIDVPQDVIDQAPEAFINPVDELGTPGTLVELIPDPADEHIDQYLLSGNAREIIPQLPKYTKEVLDKLLLAERAGQARPTLLAALGDADALNPPAEPAPARTSSTTPPPDAPAVTPLTDTSTDEEVDAYLDAKVADVVASAAGWTPELRARVLVAEEAGKNRTGVIEGLTKLSQ